MSAIFRSVVSVRKIYVIVYEPFTSKALTTKALGGSLLQYNACFVCGLMWFRGEALKVGKFFFQHRPVPLQGLLHMMFDVVQYSTCTCRY